MKRLLRLGGGISQGGLGRKPRASPGGCVQGVQGGHPHAATVGQVGRNLIGVKKNVAEEVSVNEEDLLGLVTFQSKESIQDVCVGAELMVNSRRKLWKF